MTVRVSLVVGILGALGWIATMLVDPVHAMRGYLAAWTIVITLVVGVLLQIHISYIAAARWFATYRRMALHTIATLPVLALLVIPILLDLGKVYPWAAPGAVVADPNRHGWLTPWWFVVRTVIYLLIFLLFAQRMRRWALAQDDADPPAMVLAMHKLRKWSAAGSVVVSLALTFAAFDWLLALQPSWHSTMFGVFIGAGATLSALGWIAIRGMLAMRRQPELSRWIGENEVLSLGAMLLTFVIFWGYIAFAQYLIIWIGDLPSDAFWYVNRTAGGWRIVEGLVILLQFVIPFCVLLPHATRRRVRLLAGIGVLLLVGHVLEVVWVVLPAAPINAITIIATVVALLGITAWCMAFAAHRARGVNALPVGDPDLSGGIATD